MKLAHAALLVRDVDAMVDFYVGLLGLRVSDRGFTRGRDSGPPIVFLSFDRAVTHHQIALIGAAEAPKVSRVHHLAFEVQDLAALRRWWAAVVDDPRAGGLDGPRPTAVFQGDQWSLRLRDPEGNGIEIYAPTPWDVRQPFFIPMDLSLDDEALAAWAQEALRGQDHWPRGTRPTAS